MGVRIYHFSSHVSRSHCISMMVRTTLEGLESSPAALQVGGMRMTRTEMKRRVTEKGRTMGTIWGHLPSGSRLARNAEAMGSSSLRQLGYCSQT
jgi:hypothetical protein